MRSLHPAAADHSVSIRGSRCTALIILSLRSSETCRRVVMTWRFYCVPLRATAQSLGHAMSRLVVQERHLWLCLTDMKEQEKVQFLNAPVSQTGLFGDVVESCAQQFSAAQKQTEAIKHIMRQRKPAASTPAAAPQPARRRGRSPAAAPDPTLQQQPSTRRRRGASHRKDAQPVQAPAKPGGKRKCKRP